MSMKGIDPALIPPVLSCAEAGAFERDFFGGSEELEWAAMCAAGRAVADGVLRDFEEVGGFPSEGGRVLVIAGKGNNAGDAFIAAERILERHASATIEVVFALGDRNLRPLATRAWRELQHGGLGEIAAGRLERELEPRSAAQRSSREPGRVGPAGGSDAPQDPRRRGAASPSRLPRRTGRGGREAIRIVAVEQIRGPYDVCLDGVFGFQFRPPLTSAVATVLRRVNGLSVRLRAAVDLPSGLDEQDAFRADFTYATGAVKAPVLELENAGRVRYLDLGFFAPERDVVSAPDRVLSAEVLRPLAGLRPAQGDKRTYGHVFILGGSRSYPGAVMMNVLAALRSGVGLVTAFVPETLAPAYAAHAPEAMWVGWPETPGGALAWEGQHLLKERWQRASAIAIGSGMDRQPETRALVKDIVATSPVPVLLDGDALQPELIGAAKCELVLTPHAGEFERIAQGRNLRDFCAKTGATVVLKGAITQICSGATKSGKVYHSLAGGPVLSRGGSGDILAGLISGQLAALSAEQHPSTPWPAPLLAAARGTLWHGLAADALARSQGQTSAVVTQILQHLPGVLRWAVSGSGRSESAQLL